MNQLLEDKRSQLLSRSKTAEKEKGDGKTRYEKRVKSKFSSSVKEYNQIDMNQLFKDNILTINIPVVGETDNYIVTMSFGGLLDLIQERVQKNNNVIDLRIIIQCLIECFNKDNVYIHCSCLHPDTKLKLLDGSSPTIAEIKARFDDGEKLYAFSTDENGDFVPSEIEKVWITEKVKEFVKVTLDNGEFILTTPDHLYRLRNGSYKQAQELSIGDSLMPLYFGTTTKGYDTVKINTTGKYRSIYKLVAEFFKQDEIQGALQRVSSCDNMRYDVAIHHKDFNKHNNNPDNLQPMTAREHWEYHANLCGADRVVTDRMREASRQNAIKRNQNPTDRMLETRKKFVQAGTARNYDADRKEQQASIMRKVREDYYGNLTQEQKDLISSRISAQSKKSWENGKFDTDKFRMASIQNGRNLHSPEVEKLTKDGISRYWETISQDELDKRISTSRQNLQKAHEKQKGVPFTQEHKDKIRQSRLSETEEQKKSRTLKIQLTKIKNTLLKLVNNNLDMTIENYNQYRGNNPDLLKYFGSVDEAVKFFELNHKVANIDIVYTDETPVYDIKMKNSNNFLVDAGVILHNCPDWKYRMAFWATKNDINSGEPQESNGKWIRNPEDQLGPGCKHVMLCLANTGWIIKVASVINNYIKYMSQHYQKMYQTIIYPAIYGKEYEGDIQLDIYDQDELDTSKETVDVANIEGGKSGRFKAGNKYRYQKQEKPDEEQITIDETEDEEET